MNLLMLPFWLFHSGMFLLHRLHIVSLSVAVSQFIDQFGSTFFPLDPVDNKLDGHDDYLNLQSIFNAQQIISTFGHKPAACNMQHATCSGLV